MSKETILIVDDDEHITMALSKLLNDKYDVLLFNNPEYALEEIKVNRDIKLVISDYMMPVIDGYSFLIC